MGNRIGKAVTKASLVINIMSISILILLSIPAAFLIGMFLFSLFTEELFDLEGILLFAIGPILLLFSLIILIFCLIITVGCRVYLDSIDPVKDRKRGHLGLTDIVWVIGLTVVNAALLLFLGAGGSMEAGEAIALCFILMLGMGFLALNYGLTTLHLVRFHDRKWAQFHRGLARLPPFLLLIGFPAVVLLELLESVPFISMLFVFCWGMLIASFITTLVTSVRMMVALRSPPKGPKVGDMDGRSETGTRRRLKEWGAI